MQSEENLSKCNTQTKVPNMVAWHANLEIKVLIHEIQ